MLDILHDSMEFNASDILRVVIPSLRKGRAFVPMYKYLAQIGIKSEIEFNESDLHWNKKPNSLASYSNNDHYSKQGSLLAFEELKEKYIEKPEFMAKAMLGMSLENTKDNLGEIEEFLSKNYENLIEGSYKSDFYKLICLYDQARFGWER